MLLASHASASGTPSGSGPSFDCRAATQDIEKLICADPKLAALDKELAEVYFRHRNLASPDAKDRELKAQRAFLAERQRQCKIPKFSGDRASGVAPAAACLSVLYEERLAELKADSNPQGGVVAQPGITSEDRKVGVTEPRRTAPPAAREQGSGTTASAQPYKGAERAKEAPKPTAAPVSKPSSHTQSASGKDAIPYAQAEKTIMWDWLCLLGVACGNSKSYSMKKLHIEIGNWESCKYLYQRYLRSYYMTREFRSSPGAYLNVVPNTRMFLDDLSDLAGDINSWLARNAYYRSRVDDDTKRQAYLRGIRGIDWTNELAARGGIPQEVGMVCNRLGDRVRKLLI